MPHIAKFLLPFVGAIVAVGNFFPNLPVYGFDRYVFEQPYGFKLIWSFMAILIVASFPLLQGKSKLYDQIYSVTAIVAVAFLFPRGYVLLRDILAGIDPYHIYLESTGEPYRGNSVFFPFLSRFAIIGLFCGYLLWSLRFGSLTGREITLFGATVALSTGVVVETVCPVLR